MRPLNGLGGPNYTWTTMTAREVQAILELNPECLLLIGYPNSPVLDQKIEQEAGIYEQLGRPPTLLRVYAPDIFERDPILWAGTFTRLVKRYRDAGMDVEGVGDNEPRIEAPGKTIKQTTLWRSIFGQEVKEQLPNLRLHCGADAPGEHLEDDWFYQRDHDLQAIYDVRDAHAYTPEQLAQVALARRLFKLPVWLTEFNQMLPSQVLANAPAGVEACCYFILSGEGRENVRYWLLTNATYYDDFKTARNGETPSQDAPLSPSEGIPELQNIHGGSMALKDEHPDEFAAWEAAGGVENNFRKHLLGIGVIAATAEDLEFLADEAASGIAQLKGTLNAFLG